MHVLGLGFPRTGTTSLRHALEQLGLGPCHHMMVLNLEPHRVGLWEAVEQGTPGAAEAALAGFGAAVDNPACALWRRLVQAFPDAKVVVSVRDPHDWYASYMEAIHPHTFGQRTDGLPDAVARMLGLLRRTWLEGLLDDRAEDEAHCVAAFQRHVDAVTAAVPDTLVYEVGEGWGPLCAHLGVPVPDAPFPHRNARSFVREHGVHER